MQILTFETQTEGKSSSLAKVTTLQAHFRRDNEAFKVWRKYN